MIFQVYCNFRLLHIIIICFPFSQYLIPGILGIVTGITKNHCAVNTIYSFPQFQYPASIFFILIMSKLKFDGENKNVEVKIRRFKIQVLPISSLRIQKLRIEM